MFFFTLKNTNGIIKTQKETKGVGGNGYLWLCSL